MREDTDILVARGLRATTALQVAFFEILDESVTKNATVYGLLHAQNELTEVIATLRRTKGSTIVQARNPRVIARERAKQENNLDKR